MPLDVTAGTERRSNFELRDLVDLTLSAAPSGNVSVMDDGIWIIFRDRGNVHVYPDLDIIEVSREGALGKARELADAYRREGYGEYEVSVKEQG